jgi:hypothetical protein
MTLVTDVAGHGSWADELIFLSHDFTCEMEIMVIPNLSVLLVLNEIICYKLDTQ